jgi:hypothetical protein
MVIQTAGTSISCMHASPAFSTVQAFRDDAVTRFGNQALSSVISAGLLDRCRGKDLHKFPLRWVSRSHGSRLSSRPGFGVPQTAPVEAGPYWAARGRRSNDQGARGSQQKSNRAEECNEARVDRYADRDGANQPREL